VDAIGTEIAEAESFTGTPNTTVIAQAKKIDGYELNDAQSKSVLLDADNKEIVFKYRYIGTYSYTVQYLGNVKEGSAVRYLNLPIEELKKAAIAQMKDGQPVWFGCDVGKHSERDSGIMDLDIRGLEDLLDTRFTMTKAERLDYGQSLMTHAMVFQGVNLDENGKPNRWRVENSWGKEPGKDGYYLMTDRWFDEYMYQVVVNKKYLTAEQIAAYEAEPIALEPWDPMGSLAVVR